MAEISLRIFTENNKTHTKFAIARSDTLVFKNDADMTLRVTVDKADALIEHGKEVDLFKVEPGEERAFTVNQHYPLGSTFKYTATIAGSETEDPVIIIDRH